MQPNVRQFLPAKRQLKFILLGTGFKLQTIQHDVFFLCSLVSHFSNSTILSDIRYFFSGTSLQTCSFVCKILILPATQ